jgi:hypothetical protein
MREKINEKTTDVKLKERTVVDTIKSFLYENGMKKTKEIFNYVKARKPTVTPNSINVTLWNHRDIFINKGYGIWDLKEKSLLERKSELTVKLILLNKHYLEIMKKNKINGDTRLAGIEFDKNEEIEMEKLLTVYQKKEKNHRS